MAQTPNYHRDISNINQQQVESVDSNMISLMRLILAASALLIIYLDPSEPDQLVGLTYSALIIYTFYCAILYYLTIRRSSLIPVRASYWIDVGWYTLLISLSSGTSSIFFFFYFFAILVASFRGGFKEGLEVVITSVLLFSAIGWLTSPGGQAFELNRFLLRPIYLFALGYMMAYWGGYEIKLKRQLKLLKEAIKLSNPRFGVDQMVGSVMERVRAFYDADVCLLVLQRADDNSYLLRKAERGSADGDVQTSVVKREEVAQLLRLATELAVINNCRLPWWQLRRKKLETFKIESGGGMLECQEQLADPPFPGKSFISVPFFDHGERAGRIYLVADTIFTRADLEFILQVIDHVSPFITNIRLVDKLASSAAEEERKKIARDIHDSVIQPYIGIQLGLEGVRKAAEGNEVLSQKIGRLLKMTETGIVDLRGYIGGMRGNGAHKNSLLPGVRRFAARFSEATAISIEVRAINEEACLNDRLAAEAFQMITEGLSNIRRHTHATSAIITIGCAQERFIMSIENNNPTGETMPLFTPGSITARTQALGGTAHITQRADGGAIVNIEIPL